MFVSGGSEGLKEGREDGMEVSEKSEEGSEGRRVKEE